VDKVGLANQAATKTLAAHEHWIVWRTFDPIHRGHLALARAALERFHLSRILFVPANIPPHKQRQPLLGFPHRYAMIALATAQEKDFAPSLLEAPEDFDGTSAGREKTRLPKRTTTIDTVSALSSRSKSRPGSLCSSASMPLRTIAKWHQAEALFRECEFVVASRPGFSLADVATRCLRACVHGWK